MNNKVVVDTFKTFKQNNSLFVDLILEELGKVMVNLIMGKENWLMQQPHWIG